MKRSAIIAMAALLMSAAVPAFALQEAQEKEICHIAAKNCLNKADILQKKVKKLNAEIKKGNTKYSAEDLKMLELKLQDAQDQLDKMEGKNNENL